MSHFLALSDMLLALLRKNDSKRWKRGLANASQQDFTASIPLYTKKSHFAEAKNHFTETKSHFAEAQKTASVSSSNGEIDAVFCSLGEAIGYLPLNVARLQRKIYQISRLMTKSM